MNDNEMLRLSKEVLDWIEVLPVPTTGAAANMLRMRRVVELQNCGRGCSCLSQCGDTISRQFKTMTGRDL